jgi:hypothetical protein
MSEAIPFAKLGIPPNLEKNLAREAPARLKLAIAKGLLPMSSDVQLAALYVLASDPDATVSEAALASVRELPNKQILGALSARTHPKVLELLTEFHEADFEIDERIGLMRTANDRTAVRIAGRADKTLCERMAQNQERLLTTPEVFVSLYNNPNCADVDVERMSAFLRMQKQHPDVPAVRPFRAAPAAEAPTPAAELPVAPAAPAAPAFDPMAEIEAALMGKQSPALLKAQEDGLDMFAMESSGKDNGLGGFTFDFKDDTDTFSWNLLSDEAAQGEDRVDEVKSMEKRIAEMTIGQKIKLAYLGNKETRTILLRDRNKMVAGAVVKSGRMSDGEIVSVAGNRNLDSDVLREVAMNGEWTRKYPVKVALVNNPKTPVAMAMAMVSQLQKKELQALLRNHNVPSVVTQTAQRLYRQKHRD